MFLVLLQHTMDDLPVGLFENLDEAKAFAKALDPYPTAEMRAVFGADCSTPSVVKIVRFERAEQKPGTSYSYFPKDALLIRDLDAEVATA